MDADRKELVHRLFVMATEVAEAAYDAAVSGQPTTASPAALAAAAEDLCRHADELRAIGRTISIATGDETAEPPAQESS